MTQKRNKNPLFVVCGEGYEYQVLKEGIFPTSFIPLGSLRHKKL
jgi:hypothetical protein